MNYAREETSKILLSAVGDLWRFPLWWYTGGLKFIGQFVVEKISDTWERLAIALFLKYFFKPMYGDYSWSGRIISFFMRLVLIVYKSTRLFLWVIWYGLILILWLAVLPASIWFIIW